MLFFTVLASVGLYLYLPYRAVRNVEQVWDDYLFSCDFNGIDPDYLYTGSDAHMTLRCMHSDLSRPLGESHMVAAYNAEEGKVVYDIRMAIETLIKAHDGGRLPQPPTLPDS